jgi:hypothetical protein
MNPVCEELTVGDALAQFRRAHGLDAGYAAAPVWRCRIGPVTLTLPNFKWRREAITSHDLHHIVTGYPCSMRGEFQMAAWEFAAGRFPHPAATLFCLPLVAAGVCWSPRAIWRAFLAGRRCRTFYGMNKTQKFLQLPVAALKAEAGRQSAQSRYADALAFAGLLLQAILAALWPPLVAGALLLL